jgi:hypothetical protein
MGITATHTHTDTYEKLQSDNRNNQSLSLYQHPHSSLKKMVYTNDKARGERSLQSSYNLQSGTQVYTAVTMGVARTKLWGAAPPLLVSRSGDGLS